MIEIGGLQKVTLIDYPGKLACTVFLIGCNFSCPWCYNPELVLPEKIKKHKKISEKYFFEFLKQRKGLLEGVAICGGEPTINKKLPNFIKKIKKLGYAVKLDTNGSNPKMLKNLVNEKLIDYVAMDIKTPLAQFSISLPRRQAGNFPACARVSAGRRFSKYDKATGVKADLNKIKKSIEIIKNSGIDYEFRTTVVPGVHTKEDILQIAKEITPAKKYYLQNFQPEKTINPKFEKIRPFSQNQLKNIQKECGKYLPTKIRD